MILVDYDRMLCHNCSRFTRFAIETDGYCVFIRCTRCGFEVMA